MLTIAEIINDVLVAVGSPPQDWLSLKDVARLVRNRLAYRLTRLAQSDQNQNTSVISFRLGYDADGYPIDDESSDPREQTLQDVGNPVWAERRVSAGNGSSGIWEYVPTVNLDSLEDWRNEARAAVSFYRDGALDAMKMRYTFAPTEWSGNDSSGDNFRVWFDPNVATQSALESPTNLPPNFNFLIADDVIVSIIPVLMNNVARLSNGGEIVAGPLQISAWQSLQADAARRLAEWDQSFNEYRNRSKGSQRGRQRRPVLRRSAAW